MHSLNRGVGSGMIMRVLRPAHQGGYGYINWGVFTLHAGSIEPPVSIYGPSGVKATGFIIHYVQ